MICERRAVVDERILDGMVDGKVLIDDPLQLRSEHARHVMLTFPAVLW